MHRRAKTILFAVTVAMLFVSLGAPAEARKRIRLGGLPSFGSSDYSEKIDKVYDLPDTGAYFHDGKYYDIGNFYTVSDGARAIPKNPSFVLYNGDRYVRLDDAQLAIIREDLGFDPTESFRKEYAAKYPAQSGNTSPNAIERREGETIGQFRDRVRAMAGGSSGRASTSGTEAAGVPSSGGGSFGGALFALVMTGVVLVGALKYLRRKPAPLRSANPDDLHHLSFDERVAQRLREAREQGPMHTPAAPATPLATAMPAPAMAPAGVRTFGRKTV